ncbi:MAG: hypothetical protein ACXVPU_03245 [Bacteroidia bacterium]
MKYNYKLLVLFAFFIVAIISSCELYNPAEPIPAYIHIQKIDLTTTPSQGTNSNKICDAWVYIDEQIVGCFELPCTFPVLFEGKHHIRIKAGIKVNGIATNRAPYPFYNFFEQDIDLEKGKVLTLTPTTTYTSTTNFTFMQDFESTGTTIDTTPNTSDTNLQVVYSPAPGPTVFEGTHAGAAFLDATHTRFECETVTPLVLPKGGAPVFLEFNYKCNYQFTISLYAFGSGGTGQFLVLHFNPSTDWNKTYVYLSPTVSGAYTADNYKLAWGIINATGESNIALYMDNIKIIN